MQYTTAGERSIYSFLHKLAFGPSLHLGLACKDILLQKRQFSQTEESCNHYGQKDTVKGNIYWGSSIFMYLYLLRRLTMLHCYNGTTSE